MYIENKKKSKFTIKEFVIFTLNYIIYAMINAVLPVGVIKVINRFSCGTNKTAEAYLIIGLAVTYVMANIYLYIYMLLCEIEERK